MELHLAAARRAAGRTLMREPAAKRRDPSGAAWSSRDCKRSSASSTRHGFHAFDKATGKLLWEFQMEAGGCATPCTYSVGGRQFVLITAGGGGKPETKPGNGCYAFALPEK